MKVVVVCRPWLIYDVRQNMKTAFLMALCTALFGCATAQHHSALRVVHRADPTLSAETTVVGFERRLAYLGATIESASVHGASRSAVVLTPTAPGSFPPRRVRVVYTVTADGMVQLQDATILSLMIVDHEKA